MSEQQSNANDTEKHSVCHLQEVLKLRGCAPRYQFEEISNGRSRAPFVCTVHFNDRGQRYDAEAAGSTKREAKKNAAAILLQKLEGTTFVVVEKEELEAEKKRNEEALNADQAENPIGVLQDSVGKHINMSVAQSEANDADKHPVSQLHEVLTPRGCAPAYEFAGISTGRNKPLFVCTVNFEDRGQRYDAQAAGSTKKEAKKNAAAILLQKLEGRTFIEGEIEKDELVAEKLRKEDLLNADNVENSIGVLQEVCVREKWLMPTYAEGPMQGDQQNRLFKVVCSVRDYEEAAKSSNKKVAKRLAALDMCIRLLEDANISEGSKIKLNRVCRHYSDWKSKEAKDDASRTKDETKGAHADADDCDGPKVDELILQQIRDKGLRAPNPIRMLEDLADEKQIPFEYIPFGKDSNGDIQYLLMTGTNPQNMHHGSGATDEEARINAASNALQFFKNVSTKLVV